MREQILTKACFSVFLRLKHEKELNIVAYQFHLQSLFTKFQAACKESIIMKKKKKIAIWFRYQRDQKILPKKYFWALKKAFYEKKVNDLTQ